MRTPKRKHKVLERALRTLALIAVTTPYPAGASNPDFTLLLTLTLAPTETFMRTLTHSPTPSLSTRTETQIQTHLVSNPCAQNPNLDICMTGARAKHGAQRLTSCLDDPELFSQVCVRACVCAYIRKRKRVSVSCGREFVTL